MTGHKNIYNFREKWSSPPFGNLRVEVATTIWNGSGLSMCVEGNSLVTIQGC